MNAISYSKFRQNLRSVIRKVTDDVTPIIVTTNDDSDVVVMSKHEYESLMETFHLMRSPANRERLNKSIKALESGGGTTRSLVEVNE